MPLLTSIGKVVHPWLYRLMSSSLDKVEITLVGSQAIEAITQSRYRPLPLICISSSRGCTMAREPGTDVHAINPLGANKIKRLPIQSIAKISMKALMSYDGH